MPAAAGEEERSVTSDAVHDQADRDGRLSTTCRQGHLDAKTREAIALVVAAVDQCTYCQAAHTAGGKAVGLTEQETIEARHGTSRNPKLQALLTLVKEQISDLGNVSDASWRAALDAGWSDAQLAEVELGADGVRTLSATWTVLIEEVGQAGRPSLVS